VSVRIPLNQSSRIVTIASIEWPAMPADLVADKPKSQPHREVWVGNIETGSGGLQVFSAVARSDTDIKVLIGRSSTPSAKPKAPY
jgi:hypothetical protein